VGAVVVRTEEDPTIGERGEEIHPAYGMIGASRISISPPGTNLFDSDILHRNTVRIRIHSASRKRDLGHDWIHSEKEYVEVELSEAQWASFVSSMNVGDGVPCSIRYLHGEYLPEFPHDPRLAHSIQETRNAANQAFERIQSAMAVYEALPSTPAAEKKTALRNLHFAIENATPNVDFASKSLMEQTENVVQKARADVEAFVITKARQLGLEPSDLGTPFALGSADETA
jgi:hypothetical protein